MNWLRLMQLFPDLHIALKSIANQTPCYVSGNSLSPSNVIPAPKILYLGLPVGREKGAVLPLGGGLPNLD